MDSNRPYVFISYSRKDDAFVTLLASSFRLKGINYWLDLDYIPPGEVWDDKIHEALKNCERLMVVLSPDSMASAEVGAEWKFARYKGIPIIPVYLRTCEIHYRLNEYQYVDFRKTYQEGIDKLIKALSTPVSITSEEAPVEDVETLRARLNDESWHVRLDVVDTLIKMAAGAGLLALIDALGESHPLVREHAYRGSNRDSSERIAEEPQVRVSSPDERKETSLTFRGRVRDAITKKPIRRASFHITCSSSNAFKTNLGLLDLSRVTTDYAGRFSLPWGHISYEYDRFDVEVKTKKYSPQTKRSVRTSRDDPIIDFGEILLEKKS